MKKIKRTIKFLSFKKNKGFTLIELLIVISIVAALSGLLLANFIGVRQRARDGERKSDLRQIQSALELYRSDDPNGRYKTHTDLNGNSILVPCGEEVSTDDAVYMKRMPCDPLSDSETLFNDGNYHYSSEDGDEYTLTACLENSQDPEGVEDASFTGCPSGKFYVLTNP